MYIQRENSRQKNNRVRQGNRPRERQQENKRKLPLQRDRYFQAVRPLSEYVRLAQENDAITD